MPSFEHEGLLQPFQYCPELAAELLVDSFGLTLPTWQRALIADANLTEPVPTEYYADTVVILYDRTNRGTRRRRPPSRRNPYPDAGTPVRAIVVEVQRKYHRRKAYAWPAYLANLRARLECPVILLVICPTAKEVTSCAEPIDMGHPDWILAPLVMGPDRLPVVTDPATAVRHPDLTVLSALAHGGAHPKSRRVLRAFTQALRTVETEQASIYHEIVYAALPVAARRHLEELMGAITLDDLKLVSPLARKYAAKGMAEGRAKGMAEGKAEGRVEAVLTVLGARGIDLPDEARDRISGCTDLDQLDAWIRRAATVKSIDELLAE